MSERINDVVPTIRSRADLEQLSAANPGRPVVLYISGVHADGSPCPGCEIFEQAEHATLRAERDNILFAQIPVQLDIPSFTALGNDLGLTLVEEGGDAPRVYFRGQNGLEIPAGTPMLLRMQRADDGSLSVQEQIVYTPEPAGRFAGQLRSIYSNTPTPEPVVAEPSAERPAELPPSTMAERPAELPTQPPATETAPAAPAGVPQFAFDQSQLLSVGIKISDALRSGDANAVRAVEAFIYSQGGREGQADGRLSENEVTAALNILQLRNGDPALWSQITTLGTSLGVEGLTLPAGSQPAAPATPASSATPESQQRA